MHEGDGAMINNDNLMMALLLMKGDLPVAGSELAERVNRDGHQALRVACGKEAQALAAWCAPWRGLLEILRISRAPILE